MKFKYMLKKYLFENKESNEIVRNNTQYLLENIKKVLDKHFIRNGLINNYNSILYQLIKKGQVKYKIKNDIPILDIYQTNLNLYNNSYIEPVKKILKMISNNYLKNIKMKFGDKTYKIDVVLDVYFYEKGLFAYEPIDIFKNGTIVIYLHPIQLYYIGKNEKNKEIENYCYDSLVHEMQHFYDNIRFSKILKFPDKYEDGMDSYETYRKNRFEINSSYIQTLNYVERYINNKNLDIDRDFKNIVNIFINKYGKKYFYSLSKNEQKRLLDRLFLDIH